MSEQEVHEPQRFIAALIALGFQALCDGLDSGCLPADGLAELRNVCVTALQRMKDVARAGVTEALYYEAIGLCAVAMYVFVPQARCTRNRELRYRELRYRNLSTVCMTTKKKRMNQKAPMTWMMNNQVTSCISILYT